MPPKTTTPTIKNRALKKSVPSDVSSSSSTTPVPPPVKARSVVTPPPVLEVPPALPPSPPADESTPPVPEVAPPPPPTVDIVVNDRFEVLITKLNDLSNVLKDLQLYTKSLQKEVVKLTKSSCKRTRTRSAATGAKKTPSGFAKPTKLSNELCAFLEVEPGTELARTDVTRRINQYIKENNLQFPDDKRKIRPDAKLSSVLNLKDGDNLTFFNLQSYIKHNFVKTTV